MNETTRFAKIPDESVAAITDLEKKIKQTTAQDVVCLVYEKTER